MDGAFAVIDGPVIEGPAIVSPAITFDAVRWGGAACRRSSRPCSSWVVLAVEICVRKPVSRPRAMQATAPSTRTPRPRRIHSPACSERFIAANTRPPASSASARDVAAPRA